MSKDILEKSYEKEFPHTHGENATLDHSHKQMVHRRLFIFPLLITPQGASRSKNMKEMAVKVEPYQSR
ncbi:hypothetical protein EUGRSUZ_C00256 [Eucalyptus grandis]|uniref:Uncharacterized protein n=2 Tax=Eucalyptus grandis TaxID=71139 RepID=A0ACC3LB75_EUCGR|nr:hypothetical protein EUGRSUZ_C00256 [Eucalyptus grandis]